MTNQNLPTIANPIGDTLIAYLAYNDMKMDDLLDRTGYSNEKMIQYFYGKEPVSQDFAEKLAKVFNAPAEFWLTLDQNYHDSIKRQPDL
ncbi:MAG: transcriptional regulator [Candidatus Pristimantibacillus sp.]